MNQHEKVLVIAPSWVGDLVMSQALLRLIKNRNPKCSIDVFALSFLHPLLHRMPEVANCISSSLNHGELKLYERFKIGKKLRRNFYTRVYVLPNSFKSALIPFWANIPHRIGWCGEARYLLLNDVRFFQKKFPQMVTRYIALGYGKNEKISQQIILPKLHVLSRQRDLILERLQIFLSDRPILAICPGASFGDAKRWPASHFAEIARAKKNEGWEVWIFGSEKERVISKEIQARCYGICLDFAGKTDLGETVDLMSLVTAVLTNDSGLLHIAAALSKPLVAVYGPTPPSFAPPLSHNKFKILSLNLSCSPCRKRKCPLKDNKCMHGLTPELILKSITDVTC